MTRTDRFDSFNEVVRVAALLFLRQVCSGPSVEAANRESGIVAEYDNERVDQAYRLIRSVFCLCVSIVDGDDPLGELENSPMMDIRLSGADPLEHGSIIRIQAALRGSFVGLLQTYHADPKLESVDGHGSAVCGDTMLMLERDMNLCVPLLTKRMDPNLSVSARIFTAFYHSLVGIIEDNREAMRPDSLAYFQPEVAVFALFALRCIRVAKMMVDVAQSRPAVMLQFLLFDAETWTVYTEGVVEVMRPVMERYADRCYPRRRAFRGGPRRAV